MFQTYLPKNALVHAWQQVDGEPDPEQPRVPGCPEEGQNRDVREVVHGGGEGAQDEAEGVHVGAAVHLQLGPLGF